MKNVIKKINVDGVEYDIQGKELTKVTYAELKSLRDNGELVEGHLYRITDYEFTTVQADTKSAGHVFDIIVLATSANELSHIARAIAHEGDTYFDGNDLGAWELLYDLDNDTTKYEWADAENGRGVIYRMIDEKRNDCPYDFKNILFYNDKYTSGTTSDKYYYTFSYVVSGVLYDGTVEKQVTKCYGNSMGAYTLNNKRSLNRNVWRNTGFWNNCFSNTLGSYCINNTFGDGCYNNTFRDSCYNNTFGDKCYSNTFGRGCNSTTFGDNCGFITLGYNCYNNTFGDNCYDNTLGNGCSSTTLGNGCSNNTFGDTLSNREVSRSKTSITLNDEYYDDGSGQLVPIKHPDLSTQPSILPYKFMGNYVYEQLIPIENPDKDSSTFRIGEDVLRRVGFPINGCVILEADEILLAEISHEGYPSVTLPYKTQVSVAGSEVYGEIKRLSCSRFRDELAVYNKLIGAYLRVVYTTLPEEGGDYYGYNNY